MARAMTLVLAASFCGGCYHASSYSPASTQAKWRAMSASTGAGTRAPASTSTSSSTPGLTAEEVYALAVENSGEVIAADAAADVALAEVDEEKQIDNPQLRFTGFNVDDVMASQTAMNIGLRVPIPRPGSVRARAAAARHLAEGERAVSAETKRLLRSDVYKLFAELAKLEAEVTEAKKHTALAAERQAQIGARADMQVATALDVAMAEVTHAEAVHDEARLGDEIFAIEAELSRLAGLRGATDFAIDTSDLSLVDLELDREALIELAMASRPELRTVAAEVAAADAEVHVAKGEAWPWFDWAQIQYRASPNRDPAAFGFGVAINLPVFSWNRGAIKATKAAKRGRELEERARIMAVANEVDAALLRVEQTAARVTHVDRELMPKIDAARREAEAALRSGALDPVDASEIDERAVDAERLRLDALLEHREAVIDLETAVGAPLPGVRGKGGQP